MALSPIDFLNGLFSLIFILVTIIVGLKIALNYFKIKNRIFLFVGFGWALMCSAWYPSSASFICYLILGKGLEPIMYFFIGNVFMALSMILFITGLTDMICKQKQKQKIIIAILVLINVVYNIYFYYNLFTDPNQIGFLEGYFDVTYVRVVSIYLFWYMITVFTFTVLFALQARKSDHPEVKLKGIFIMIAISLFLIGSFLDALIALTEITLIITRCVLISSSILFYLGFLMPEFLKRRVTEKT